MSYHEITTSRNFNVKCRDCDFNISVSSAGTAEHFAEEHISLFTDDNDSPNYNHVVAITEETLVGRNV